MTVEPVLLSWSGGKDAAWTLHRLRQSGVPVAGLITTVTAGYERVSMQGIRREVLHAQAMAAGLPLIEAMIPPACDNAVYEAAFASALRSARERWPRTLSIAFGDLFLQDIRDYRVAMCASLGWRVLTPLFGSDTASLAREMQAGGLKAAICCVDTRQLSAGFSGCDFDAALLDALPADVDPCGENGEFHTCVHAGPMFERPISIARGETLLRDQRFAYTDFELQTGPAA
ncbi:ATP-binding protein [Pseudoxanthomonas sacheonensis]|uniref:Dph6-related ATP pyrophosphatase n=1 Tax=Pseudoxanthomonas sacheonensis TaxID=443615 RepID=UPI0013CFDE68|nr:ATP-binding protein [Pseudoxanthomonas sacheonensis]KAF1707446.1 ATP-binding protein [Pseudoxanthomonas sacheonensis]